MAAGGGDAADGSDEGEGDDEGGPSTRAAAAGTLRMRRGAGSKAAAAAAAAEAEAPEATSRMPRRPPAPPRSGGSAAPRPARFDAARCGAFAAFLVLWLVALAALSDLYLRAHPEAQCLPRAAAAIAPALGLAKRPAASPSPSSSSSPCWLAGSHGFALSVADYTPNIGLHWYLLTELFDAFRPFFKFVLHSQAPLLAAPLALRFPRRPLFVAWALLLAGAALRSYPSAGDAACWLALAPAALAQQARQLRRGALFFANGLALLAALGPAMWHQWISVDAANPNFFYSITLLLGVLHVAALVAGVLLTARVERLAAGKPVVGDGSGGDGSGGVEEDGAVDGAVDDSDDDGKDKDA